MILMELGDKMNTFTDGGIWYCYVLPECYENKNWPISRGVEVGGEGWLDILS